MSNHNLVVIGLAVPTVLPATPCLKSKIGKSQPELVAVRAQHQGATTDSKMSTNGS